MSLFKRIGSVIDGQDATVLANRLTDQKLLTGAEPRIGHRFLGWVRETGALIDTSPVQAIARVQWAAQWPEEWFLIKTQSGSLYAVLAKPA